MKKHFKIVFNVSLLAGTRPTFNTVNSTKQPQAGTHNHDNKKTGFSPKQTAPVNESFLWRGHQVRSKKYTKSPFNFL